MPNDSLDTNGVDNNGNGGSLGSWAIYQRLVLSEIKQNKLDNADNAKDINQLRIDMAVIQTKAAITGAVIGFCTSAVTSAVAYFIIEKLLKG